MVGFTETLAALALPEWGDRYLDYRSLTEEILAIQVKEAEMQRLRSRGKEDVAQEVKIARRQLDFTRMLDEEIEKVVTFFLEMQGQMASRLWSLRKTEREDAVSGATGAALILCKGYQDLAAEMGRLLDYACINIDAIRKILKKFDASVAEPQEQLAVAFLQSRRMSRYSAVAILFDDTGLRALVGGIRRGFEAVNDRLERLVGRDNEPSPRSREAPMRSQLKRMETQDLDTLEHKIKRLERARKKTERSMVYVMSDILLERSHIERELWGDEEEDGEDELDVSNSSVNSGGSTHNGSGHGRRRRSQGANHGGSQWDSHRLEKVIAQHVEPPREGYSLGLWLNLWGTFLYLLGLTIAIPTVASYAQYLGVDEDVSGVVLSSTPFAVMVATVLLSQWTNSSFRQPLLFTISLQLVGHLLYALALPLKCFPLVIVGRFLTGLGAIRPINRRYISECVSLDVRTAAAATFVGVGAMGMACGPALSVLFDKMDWTPMGWRVLTINRLTAPGWIMVLLWVVYLVILAYYFPEPRQYRHRHRAAIEKRVLSKVKAEGLLARRGVSYGSVLEMDDDLDEEIAKEEEKHKRKKEQEEEEEAKRRLLVEAGGGRKLGWCWDPDTYRLVYDKVSEPRVALCLWTYFLLKFITEALFASSPLVTHYVFPPSAWPSWGVGTLFTVLGLAVIPVNYIMGYLSLKGVHDRQILVGIQVLSLLSLVALLRYPYQHLPFWTYSVMQYVISCGLLYCLMTALEGTVLSLLSKVLAKKLSGTTFNAGLLGTEFASLGRVMGDVSITVFGLVSKPFLLDLIFTPVLVALVVLTAMTWSLYDDLVY